MVIAAAMGYGLEDYRRFLVPLRKVYKGAVVLFSDARGDALALCQALSAQVRELPLESALGVRGNRYVGYDQVCADYDACLATDFRDVVFQDDPFSALPGGFGVEGGYQLVLTQEYAAVRIRDCKHNRNWLGTCWGYDWVDSIAENGIICSGTILGTPAGFRLLRKVMLAEMAVSASKGPACTARDQGHLNYVYLTHKLAHERVFVEQQGRGIMNTVGYIPEKDIGRHLNAEGLVVNYDASVSPVVHQYDRFPQLAPLVYRLSH